MYPSSALKSSVMSLSSTFGIDGGTGFAKALKRIWPDTEHQRCVFHVFCQIRRYTTGNPQTPAGIELYAMARDLLHIKNRSEANEWTDRFIQWMKKYNSFLSQRTYDENGNSRPTHERLLKAQHSIFRLLKEGTMFTYLDESLQKEISSIPSTNNQIEGTGKKSVQEVALMQFSFQGKAAHVLRGDGQRIR